MLEEQSAICLPAEPGETSELRPSDDLDSDFPTEINDEEDDL